MIIFLPFPQIKGLQIENLNEYVSRLQRNHEHELHELAAGSQLEAQQAEELRQSLIREQDAIKNESVQARSRLIEDYEQKLSTQREDFNREVIRPYIFQIFQTQLLSRPDREEGPLLEGSWSLSVFFISLSTRTYLSEN